MLEGSRVYIEPIKREDTMKIVQWRNQPYVRERFIYQELFTPESHEHWMKTMVDTGKVAQFIIHMKEDGKAIGSAYLRDIDSKNKNAEFGIFIGEEDYLGKGIGNETARLMLKYAFEDMKLHRVFLRVFASNKRAIASYKKAGFVEEGCFRDAVRIREEYYDIMYMAILECDYRRAL